MTDFDALYRKYAGHVYRFALSLSGNRAMAEDITSETFVRIWTARDRLDLTTVMGYLLTIARRLYLQGVSSDRRRGALLERTRTLLHRRTWLLAAAVLCSAMPFAFSFDGGGIRFLLVRDAPAVGGVLMVGAFLFWALFASTVRRMRVTGL